MRVRRLLLLYQLENGIRKDALRSQYIHTDEQLPVVVFRHA